MASKTKRSKRSSLFDANHWRKFVAMSDDELRMTDVGLINLACAGGLPGSETLNVSRTLDEIDQLAARVKRETERNRHMYAREAKKHGDSPAQWTAGMLITVLQQDCGVRYNPQRIHDPDFRDSRDLFIHGMLGFDRPGGTCSSMPFLYVAVGRRLGYPMFLTSAKAHLFVRWDDSDGTRWKERDASWRHGARFNLEGSSRGFLIYPDEFYHGWPIPMTPREIASGMYLKTMNRCEELACILAQRGHCLEDNARLTEAIEVYLAATNINAAYGFFLLNAQRKADSVGIDLQKSAFPRR